MLPLPIPLPNAMQRLITYVEQSTRYEEFTHETHVILVFLVRQHCDNILPWINKMHSQDFI